MHAFASSRLVISGCNISGAWAESDIYCHPNVEGDKKCMLSKTGLYSKWGNNVNGWNDVNIPTEDYSQDSAQCIVHLTIVYPVDHWQMLMTE